jgi:hypothetical protein
MRRFVVRKSENRFIMDLDVMASDGFADICRNRPEHFTRTRKMPLPDIINSMINRKGVTLLMELRGYMRISHPQESISKVGYLKQRMKLNPGAIKSLYRGHNANFYADGNARLYKGHLVLAADGSGINIPTTPENIDKFGSPSRKGTKPQAQLGLGCIYDVLNRLILESDINRCKFDEKKVAERQLERLPMTIGELPYIIVMDRGYPSTPFMLRMMGKGIKFIIRLKSNDYKKEQSAMASNDEQVAITLDKTRIAHYEGTEDGEMMKALGSFKLRIVRVTLDTGETETLATNLAADAFGTDEMKELYSMRWGIETAYETLKDRLQLENFTGVRPILIEQDIYSTIYVSNVAEDIILDVEAEIEDPVKNRKHKMAINRTIGIGIIKNDLIHVILEKDSARRKELFMKIYEDISKNLVPKRPGRHYPRTKGQLAGKYSNTHKRSY